MLLTFNTQADLRRFLVHEAGATRFLIMSGFQRLKRWTAIPTPDLTFLYGPNSAGKGTVIDFFRFIEAWKTGHLQSHLERWHRRDTDSPLTVGLSAQVLPTELFSPILHMDHPFYLSPSASIREVLSFENVASAERGPVRLTWIASFAHPGTEVPEFELFVNGTIVASFKPDRAPDFGDGAFSRVDSPADGRFLLWRDGFVRLLGSQPNFLKLADGKHAWGKDGSLSLGEIIVWEKCSPGDVPAFEPGLLRARAISRGHLETAFFLLFLYFPGLLEGCEHVGPLRAIPDAEDLTFRFEARATGLGGDLVEVAAGRRSDGSRQGDGRDAWKRLARELAEEILVARRGADSFLSRGRSGGSTPTRTLETLNRWLHDPQFLDSGYRVAASRHLVLSENHDAVRRPSAQTDSPALERATGLLNALLPLQILGRGFAPLSAASPPGPASLTDAAEEGVIVSLFLTDESGRKLDLFDVGAGLSQVVPVIVGTFARERGGSVFDDEVWKAFAVEQPELHLHPRLQTALCDVFIESANMNTRRVHFVESHSEHMLLRLLRRIRETSSSDIRHRSHSISPSQVAVLYFEPEGDETYVHLLRIGDEGTFLDRWPRGFFDERFEELFDE